MKKKQKEDNTEIVGQGWCGRIDREEAGV